LPLPVRKPSYTGTTVAERDHPPPNHIGHLGNANLLTTTPHAGLLANFVKSRNKKSGEQKPKQNTILSTCEAMSHFLLHELPLSSILVLVISDDAINSDALASAFRRA
jgi:hypothetical protein